MPLSPDAFKYYTFRQEGTDTISGIPVYNIRFTLANGARNYYPETCT